MRPKENKRAVVYVFGAAFAVGGVALATPAEATGVGGWAGSAQPAGADCFSESYGAVTFNDSLNDPSCPGAWLHWEVVLPANAGTYYPVVEVGWPANNSAGNYIECSVTTVSQTGSPVYTSGYSSPSGTSGLANYQPAGTSGATVQSNGAMFVNCYMTQGAYIYSVNY
jgi:hypothetical protein